MTRSTGRCCRCRSATRVTRSSRPDNGLEAIAVLDTCDIDVVLTDIEMPEMDGYALLRHRHEDERLREIPFIVISGVDEMDSIIECIKLGAEDYLPKPFDPVLLHARFGRVPRPQADDRRAARTQHQPGSAGRRQGPRGRAAQHAATVRHTTACRSDRRRRRGDPAEPSSRDHGAVLRPAWLHRVRGDRRARGGDGGPPRVPSRASAR